MNFEDIVEKYLVVDNFIRVENIESNTKEVLYKSGYEKVHDKKDFPHENKSQSNEYDYHGYYDGFTKELVEYKDKFILDYFDYSF